MARNDGASTSNIKFFTGGTGERMRVSNTGFVGIGTTSPAANLDLHAYNQTNPYASASAVSGAPYVIGVDPVLSVSDFGPSGMDGAGSYLQFQDTNAAGIGDIAFIGGVSKTGQFGSTLVFGRRSGSTAYTESMRIDGLSGNVGIGTTSPNVSLDLSAKNDSVRLPAGSTAQHPSSPVNGDIRYNSSSAAIEIFAANGWQTLSTASGSTGASFYNDVSFAGAGAGVTVTNNEIIGGSPGVTGALTAGSVADVGNASIGGSLGVTGAITLGGALDLPIAAIAPAHMGMFNSAGNLLNFVGGASGTVFNNHANSVTNVTILDNGNVGVGTTGPVDPLDIVSTTLAATGANAGAGILRIATGVATTNDALLWGVHSGDYSWMQAVQPGTSNRTLALNPNGGSVGVGTTAPQARLQIAGDTAVAQLYLSGATNPNKILQLGYNTTGNFGTMQATTSGSTYDPLALNPYGGNVGIGTTSPTEVLQTIGNINTSNGGNSAGAGGYLSFGISSLPSYTPMSEVKGYLENAAGTELQGGLAFLTRSYAGGASGQVMTEKMHISSAGNVGIGTTGPISSLDIRGTSGVISLGGQSSGGYAAINIYDNAGSQQGSVGWGNSSSGFAKPNVLGND